MTGCAAIRPALGAFVDGELRGPVVRRVLRHLQECEDCSREVRDLRDLGDDLRAAAVEVSAHPALDGLASTIVSRVRAEAAQSWRATFRRACEDWHWALVGSGSVTATFVLMLSFSAALTFGVKPARDDSLSALISNLNSSAGFLFVVATPTGAQDDVASAWLMQVDNGGPPASRGTAALALRTEDTAPTEAEVVEALAGAMARHGRNVRLDELHPMDRRYIEGLLEDISRIRLHSQPRDAFESIRVHDVRLVTSTSVSAKAL
jgi:hypothetical protein